MTLKIDVKGILVELKVWGYKPPDDFWESQWCKSDFSFSAGEWLNYRKRDEEVFLSYEIQKLEEALTRLLNDELSNVEEISCMEPDFVFSLHPKRDLRGDPSILHILPGKEEDIFVEWRVYFWHTGLTPNFLSVRLERKEIIALRNYFSHVMGKG